MAKCVDIEMAWGFSVLCDWFINSVDETEEPQWTPEHIEELLDGFYVIPKRKEIAAPVLDAVPVRHGKWIDDGSYVTTAYGSLSVYTCSLCNADITIDGYSNYCPNCGADMRGENNG